jgi:hypothetical protein
MISILTAWFGDIFDFLAGLAALFIVGIWVFITLPGLLADQL